MNTLNPINCPISLKALSTGYRSRGDTRVVTSPFDAELRPGSLTCLLGPNGAGKSTLLRTLAGFMPPLSGSVDIAGRDLASMSPGQLAHTIAVVLTERPSAAHMTVYDTVALARSPYTGFWGALRDSDRQAVQQALEDTGADEMAHRNISTLSDGQLQKVMVAKALAQDTPAIFLDEPSAFLDFPSKVDLMRLLRRLAHDRSKVVLISSHDVEISLQLADTLWMLGCDGSVAIGSPAQLAADNTIADRFCRPGIGFDPKTLSFSIS